MSIQSLCWLIGVLAAVIFLSKQVKAFFICLWKAVVWFYKLSDTERFNIIYILGAFLFAVGCISNSFDLMPAKIEEKVIIPFVLIDGFLLWGLSGAFIIEVLGINPFKPSEKQERN